MRPSRGALLPPVGGSRLRRADIYGAIRAAVLDGILGAGERLPSTREAALDYGVSRGLMEEVFAQLTDEGFLRREVGRGTFVASTVSRLTISVARKLGVQRTAAASRRGRSVSANAACREPVVLRPFNAAIADTSEFPWRIWQKLQARAARELGAEALNFADPRGLPDLRSAIARYLAQFRGIRCQPGQVIVSTAVNRHSTHWLCSCWTAVIRPGSRIPAILVRRRPSSSPAPCWSPFPWTRREFAWTSGSGAALTQSSHT